MDTGKFTRHTHIVIRKTHLQPAQRDITVFRHENLIHLAQAYIIGFQLLRVYLYMDLPLRASTNNNGPHTRKAPHIISYRVIKDRKSTRLNSSHVAISYAVFCLKKKNKPTS